jgi:hypothetical protein
MKAELTIKVSDLYYVINHPTLLRTQKFIENAPKSITDKLSYDITAESLKLASEAIKTIETARKSATSPLDAYKKQIMDIEKEATAPLIEFITERKGMMLVYASELERIQREANEKIKAEAAAAIAASSADTVADMMGRFTDKLVSVQTEQPKNIRVTTKARVIEGTPVHMVDWSAVIFCLIAAEKFDVDVLLTGLAKAMADTGIKEIKGIEVYQHKTQVIR